MQSNLELEQEFTPEVWETGFKYPNLKSMHHAAVDARRVDGQSKLRLVTRSGFETRHICTSVKES